MKRIISFLISFILVSSVCMIPGSRTYVSAQDGDSPDIVCVQDSEKSFADKIISMAEYILSKIAAPFRTVLALLGWVQNTADDIDVIKDVAAGKSR